MTRVGELYRKNLVNQIKKGVEKNKSVFLLHYSNLSGVAMNDFRKNLKSAGADVFVSKNTLARLALKDLKSDALADRVTGQTAFIWSEADSVAIAKILVKFAKDCEQVALKGGLLEGRILEEADVKKLSDLPSKEILQSMLLSTILAPLTRLAGALNAKSRDLLSILKQLSEKKGGS